MKILHLADLHYRASKIKDIEIAHADSIRFARENNVDLIVISGDIWDGSTQNTASALFPRFIAMLNEYADIAPVVIIYGTPTHDISGSLDILQDQLNDFGITILKMGQPYFLHRHAKTVEKSYTAMGKKADMLVLGVPEPTKKFIAGQIETKGKTVTEATVRQEMHGTFLGLAAVRREYNQLPCILLYHGHVAGSKMQNDQQIDRGSGISITYDDLSVVGAEYYALGDIHEPQQIGDLQAYYPGALYNTNFGETYIPGCNLVEITTSKGDDLFSEGEWDVNVTRKDFNLPRQEKINITFNELQERSWDDFSFKRVWVEVKCTKEEAQKIDTKEIYDKLVKTGVDEGSKVTLDIIATETVRAAEITEKKSLREKVLVWAEASGEEVSESILQKADELEMSETSKDAFSEASSIRIDKLILRGAIGIWKGLKVDTVTVDFESLPPGIIALIGGNGQGKTTLIENLHPWPQMLTRSGTLTKHFRLRDSFRDLYFTDERTGIKYRALLEIDGKNKSGSTDYYLFRDTGKGFEPIESITGRKDAYIKEIERLFGSLTLYQKTAFITQKNTSGNPSLSSATRKVKMEIFRELAGLDYLEEYTEIAKGRAKAIETEILVDSGKIEVFDRISTEIGEKTDRKGQILTKIDEISTKKQEIRKEKDVKEHSVEVLRAKVSDNDRMKQQLATLKASREEYSESISTNQEIISTANAALKYRNDALKLKNEIEVSRTRKQELLSVKNEIDSKNNSLKEAWMLECRKVDNDKSDIKTKLEELEAKKRSIEQRLSALAFDIKSLERDTEVKPDTKCPTCQQELPEYTRQEILQKWETKTGELKVLRETEVDIKKEFLPVDKEIEKLTAEMDLLTYPPEPELLTFDDKEWQEIISFLSFNEHRYDDACSTIKKAEEATTQIKIAEEKIEDLTTKLSKTDFDIAKLEAVFSPSVDFELDEAIRQLHKSEEIYREITGQLTALEATKSEIESQLLALEQKAKELEELKRGIEVKRVQAEEWNKLKDICSLSGIQALELDALAPNIASIANHILKAAYGTKFQIEFRTVKQSGSGKKTKQLEDFSIWVMDIENGTEQLLEDLSGGEEVWVRKAIYDAFGKIRANNTGKTFLTACIDESDGALDPEMKEKYYMMLEAAHNENHRRHTITITHSREVQEKIQQKIYMEDLHETYTAYKQQALCLS